MALDWARLLPDQCHHSHVCVGLCSSQSLFILQIRLTPEEEDLYCHSPTTPGTVSLSESRRKDGIFFLNDVFPFMTSTVSMTPEPGQEKLAAAEGVSGNFS